MHVSPEKVRCLLICSVCFLFCSVFPASFGLFRFHRDRLLCFLSPLCASTPASLNCLLLSRCLGNAAAIKLGAPLRPVLATAWLAAWHLVLLIRTSMMVERKQYRGAMRSIQVCAAQPSTAWGCCVQCVSHLETVNCCLGNSLFLHVPGGILSLYVTC